MTFSTSAPTWPVKLGVAKSGDLIMITGGLPVGITGTTNLLKVSKFLNNRRRIMIAQTQPRIAAEKNGGSWRLSRVSLFMILLDVTIVNIALPHIMTSLNVSLSSIEWVINIYVLVFAVLLLTLGKLGDLFGRRRLFLIGLGIFTASSLGCSVSPNFMFLLIAGVFRPSEVRP